jgi:mRNA-degrading endonuclease toxin of MazEF toxin-antitoxin module
MYKKRDIYITLTTKRGCSVETAHFFNEAGNMTTIMPITQTKRKTPMLIPLDERTKTKGYNMLTLEIG